MKNPNDITAQYYETANQYLKNDTVLSQELELISKQVQQKATILDIGCGTGRHLIPLAQAGFHVTGIDSSNGMLSELQKKLPTAGILNADLNTLKLEKKGYDLIIMFWNTFNEIALTKSHAQKLLKNCYQALKPNSKLLINIDDSELINPKKLDFDFKIMGKPELHYFWKVMSFNKRTNTTISRESIQLPEQTLSTRITQRWWSFAQIKAMAEKTGFKCEKSYITANSELYIILSRNGK